MVEKTDLSLKNNSNPIHTKQPSQNQTDTNCLLIGDDHLIIQCAEILIQHQYTIIAMVSTFKQATDWATEHNIPIYASLNATEPLFIQKQVGYLFSIVNHRIIPNRFLHLTKKLAINYHHSPLPKYAGTHAPCWAILNNEVSHGVTWHVIDELIDGGDILQQTFFKIDNFETGLSLNQKCYQQAVILFKQLVTKLKKNTLVHIKQDLNFRTYYRFNKKPQNNGLINWHQSSQEIERYFRALSLGTYDNSFCSLKMMIKDKFYIISELKNSHDYSKSLPGTITEMTPTFWRVSTTTTDLFLIRIMSLQGKDCLLPALESNYKIAEGYRFETLCQSITKQFTHLCEKYMTYEPFWVKKLTHFEQAEMPFSHQCSVKTHSEYTLTKTLHLSNEWMNKLDAINTSNIKKSTIILTLWLIYLYRIGNKKNLGLALHYPQLTQDAPLHNIFATYLPFMVQFDEKTSFKKACSIVAKQLKLFKEKHSFLQDIFYRYQTTASMSPFISIAVLLNEEAQHLPSHASSNANLLLKISVKQKTIEWYVDTQISNEAGHLLTSIENSANHMHVLMMAAVDSPSYPITTLPLLSQNERKTLLIDWNNTYTPYPKDKSVIDYLEPIAALLPNQIALECEKTTLTYTQLFHYVNQLADILITQYQIKPQQHILVYLPRHAAWIISALAIMKIGAVYIPIAENTPINRVNLIIKDSTPTLILSNQFLINKFPEDNFLKDRYLNIEETLQAFRHYTPSANIAPVPSHFIAYIMYTSGTTGGFKGVKIKHVSLVNLIMTQIKRLNLNQNTRVLQFASIGFDASIWEIFATLMAGGTLCIPSDRHVLIGKNLSKELSKHNISLVTLPPSILQTLPAEELPSLQTIVTAGESCPKELALMWSKKVRMINAYGPTETTVCATMGVIQMGEDITIGKPISNTKAYILDEQLNPVPIGVIGELFIGGDSIAEGYLNQPTLTEHFFVSNPVSLHPEDTLYKTRDLVRWLPNGDIEYIGRVDHQIKIRGLQIEPEAIETQILHHPHVAQCVVCMQDNEKLNKFIVAYLVPHQKIDLRQLRAYLSDHLPHYMIPSFFVILDKLPLTNNGKIDRRALPKPKLQGQMNTDDFEEPSTEIEKQLCQIWSNILGLEKIGIHQDFFTIGGNSLLLSQLIITLRDHFNFEMHFSLIINNPTIASIANLVTKKFNTVIKDDYSERLLKDAQLPPDIIPLHKTDIQRNVVLLTGATGFLGAHLLKSLSTHKHLKIYCLTRAESNQEAFARIEQNIKRLGLNLSIDEHIIPIAGDISCPQLGLSEAMARQLEQEVDEIYHNAAFVHHLYNYERLRAANVVSTLELLKFASRAKHKTIHYISTLSALCHFTNERSEIIEQFLTNEENTPPSDGYNQTKWVCEKLLATAHLRGFSINIYRPSLLLGNTLKERSACLNNHLLSLIEGCVNMGYAPHWTIELDIIPVDFLSDIIVKIATSNPTSHHVFNFSNTHRMSWVAIIEFLNASGYKIKLIPPEKWTDALMQLSYNSSMFNLLPLYENDKNRADVHLNIKHSEQSHVTEALYFFNKQYPVIDKNTLSGFLHFLQYHHPLNEPKGIVEA